MELRITDPAALDRFIQDMLEPIPKVRDPWRYRLDWILPTIRDTVLLTFLGMLLLDREKVSYLLPLIQLAEEQENLTIASLNYDVVVEYICESKGIACDTGIDTWLRDSDLGSPVDVSVSGDPSIQLLKLHGSMNWEQIAPNRTNYPGDIGRLPITKVREAPPGRVESWVGSPAVVFGAGLKLPSGGPYLELLRRWAKELATHEALIVIGYSFRDQHVNEIVAQWFNRNERRHLIVVDPSDPMDASSGSFYRSVCHLADDSFRHKVEITLLKGTAEEHIADAIGLVLD